MNSLSFRPFSRYDDEADGAAYVDSEPFYASPSAESAVGNVARPDGGTYDSHCTDNDNSGKCDLLSLQRVMDMTEALQREQDDEEARRNADNASKAERMHQVRNAQWEAVKARMSQRVTPMPTARAYDSESDGDGVVLRSVSTKLSTTLNALAPSLSEEGAVGSGTLQMAETVPERFWHSVYNWFMYFVYALSASVLPGVDAHKGADSREYFDNRVS
ncbi:hypothetical protein CUR178_01408 [Leishmania enriettii]|uniref:Uncharacterized protein n=1 Tax=Leishmania enriettii TaxID=5663 RepID=A0A836KF73_LEIEN|nr:hypothetical protein CUR178_01408 [Leishmania enriettii]